MNREKHLLFLTNFSEACFQALPSIAQWIDREQGRLTLLHVADGDWNLANERLNSFFAESHRYENCERAVVTGEPAEAIASYCRVERPDIVFAPASKPSGLPRFFHRSLRARLIREEGIKLWTRGRTEGGTCQRVPRNVAHVIAGHPNWAIEACEAARFAAQFEAKLHFLYMAPWPDVHDGTFASDLRIKLPDVAMHEVETLVRRLPIRPELHSGMGTSARDLVGLLKRCRADVAFVGEDQAIRRRTFSEVMEPELDALDCEVFCFPKNPLNGPFERVLPRTRLLQSVESR